MNYSDLKARILSNKTLVQFFIFGLVGTSGALINTLILYVLTVFGGLHYLVAAAIATQVAIISNFIGNNVFTFKHEPQTKPLAKRFITFQAVSMIGLVLTLTMLWGLTNAFGMEYLLVWNLVAIVFTFIVNFTLNKAFTWGEKTVTKTAVDVKLRKPFTGKALAAAGLIVLAVLLMGTVHADIAAVSQLGYHPNANKQVVVYTQSTSGTFTINGGSYSGTLARPRDAAGNPTNCQGNNPCLVGDFSDFVTPGTYPITTSLGVQTPSFKISETIYESASEVFTEYYEAQRQQGSSYHKDMHTMQSPAFVALADGSYIMTADQAALTTIRLGSAYRRNPDLFGSELQTAIESHVDYLVGLQGTSAQAGSGPVRLRFGSYDIQAFTPGPVTQPTIDVYNANGAIVKTATVTSLCNGDAVCIAYAAQVYKCQPTEVCLHMTYNDATGTIVRDANNMQVSRGWIYDWNCFVDADPNEEFFTKSIDPCLIFDQSKTDP
jgi:putative flippase GtrA